MLTTCLYYFLICLYGALAAKNILFWLGIWQSKEYRFDRLRDYFTTPEGRRSLFSKNLLGQLLTTIAALIIPFYILQVGIISLWGLVEILLYIKRFLSNNKASLKVTHKAKLIILSSILTVILFWREWGHDSAMKIALFPLIFAILPIFIVAWWGSFLKPFTAILKRYYYGEAGEIARKYQHVKIVGITGSYGKTSVKEYAFQLLENFYKTNKTKKNLNTEMGLSQAIINGDLESQEVFVAEMAAYKIGEVKRLCQILPPDIAVITGIDEQHNSLFGGIENTLKAKSEIIFNAKKNATIILNYDNQYLRSLKLPAENKVITYALNNPADLTAEKIVMTENGLNFVLKYKNNSYNCETELISEHNVLNLLSATAITMSMGVEIEKIIPLFKEILPPDKTLAVVKPNANLTILDDSYNANPSGVKSGIKTLGSFSGHKILILDDILELGEHTTRIHQELAQTIADSKPDLVLLVGKNYADLLIKHLQSLNFPADKVLKESKVTHLKAKDILKQSLVNKKTVVLFEGRRSENYLNFYL